MPRSGSTLVPALPSRGGKTGAQRFDDFEIRVVCFEERTRKPLSSTTQHPFLRRRNSPRGSPLDSMVTTDPRRLHRSSDVTSIGNGASPIGGSVVGVGQPCSIAPSREFVNRWFESWCGSAHHRVKIVSDGSRVSVARSSYSV